MDDLFWIEQEPAVSDDEVFLPADTPFGSTSVHSLKAQRRVLDERHRRLIKRLLWKQSSEMDELNISIAKHIDHDRLPLEPSSLLEFIDGPTFLEENRDLVLLKSAEEADSNREKDTMSRKEDNLIRETYHVQMESVSNSVFDELRKRHDDELTECTRLYLEEVAANDKKANDAVNPPSRDLNEAPPINDNDDNTSNAPFSPPSSTYTPSSPSFSIMTPAAWSSHPPTNITNLSRDPRLRLQQQKQIEHPQGEPERNEQIPHSQQHGQQDQQTQSTSSWKKKKKKPKVKTVAASQAMLNNCPSNMVSKSQSKAPDDISNTDYGVPKVASSSTPVPFVTNSLKKKKKRQKKRKFNQANMLEQGTIAVQHNSEGPGGPQVVCRTTEGHISLGNPVLYDDALHGKKSHKSKDKRREVFVRMLDDVPHFFAWRPDTEMTVNVGPVQEIEPLVRQYFLKLKSRPVNY